MAVSTRIYGGGAIAFGGPAVIADLQAAGYDTVIMWSVHVNATKYDCNGIHYYPGDLILNNTRIVSQGVYAEMVPMNLPVNLASLRNGGVSILFSVGPGAWANIQTLMGTGVPGPENVLYQNFQALKNAMAAVTGGDIDGIDFDNENNIGTDVMVNFGQMLANIGYASVTLCPYSPPLGWGPGSPPEDSTTQVWIDTLQQLDAAVKPGFVSAIHLQCYSGGGENTQTGYVAEWINLINAAMGPDFNGASLMIPGLSTTLSESSKWWNKSTWSQGACVQKHPGVAQYGDGDWSGHLMTLCGTTPNAAMQTAQTNGAITFFFFCNQPVSFGGRLFNPGDAVFFTGAPRWGSAPQCDGYFLGCDCSDSLNFGLAASGCPKDLQAQYSAWNTGDSQTTPGGGFIWMYDHIMTCLTCGGCGGTAEHPTTTARAYRDAIANGLS